MINDELTLTVNDNKIIACRRGDNLFKVLCSAGYVFSGNCGGLGRCPPARSIATTSFLGNIFLPPEII